jgi:hypothetical protein
LCSNEKVLVDRLEAEEERKEGSQEIKIGQDNQKIDTKWKSKFITIWK